MDVTIVIAVTVRLFPGLSRHMPTAAQVATPMTTKLERGLIAISVLTGIVAPVAVIGYPIATGIDESAMPGSPIY